MSKILFVTQKLTANSLNQIEIIRRSGHEFTVLTSQSEKNSGLAHPDVMYFFSRWNFLELAKFLPSFLVINPDIVHVFVDSSQAVKTADFFAGLAHLFQKIFSVQFFMSEDSFFKLRRTKRLVYSADIVTGPHRTFLFHLRGMNAKNRYQIKGVIPPILHLSDSAKNPSEIGSPSAEEYRSYQILMPLKKEQRNNPVILHLAERHSVLFAIESDKWTASDIKKLNHDLTSSHAKPWRIYPVKDTLKNLESLPKTDFTLWIAGLDFELEECIQYFELSLNRKLRIVMDHTQMQLYPDIWDNNPMALIAQKHHILNFISQFKIPKTSDGNWQEQLNTTSLVDISVNEFNRLISKATNSQSDKAV